MADNKEAYRDYYYLDEVAKKLCIPKNDVWRMSLPNWPKEGKSVFPKELVDRIADSWSKISHSEYKEKYYKLEWLEDNLKCKTEELRSKAIVLYGQYWIAEEEARNFIADNKKYRPGIKNRVRRDLRKPILERAAEREAAESLIRSLQAKIEEEKIYAESLRRSLIKVGQNSGREISAELEEAKQRIRKCHEENEILRVKNTNLSEQVEEMELEVRLLEEVRNLLDSEREH